MPPLDKIPTFVPPWLDPTENHWVPPQDIPFWMWEIDHVSPGGEIDIWIPKDEPPKINKGGGDWVSAEEVVEKLVTGVRMFMENIQIPEGVLNDIIVTTYPLDEMPADILVPPGGDYCKFFQIGTNIAEYIESAEVGFMVDKDWIDANNVEITTLALEHYVKDTGTWVEITPTITGEDNDYVYCKAVGVPSFSVFAVTGKAIEVVAEVPEEVSIKAVAAIGIGVLVVAFAIVLLKRRTGHPRRKRA